MTCPHCGKFIEDKHWRYRRRKMNAGQCSRCTRNATPGHATCRHCRLEMRIKSRRRRKAHPIAA